MKLLQLRYFQTVCRMNSVSKAAAALHVSQPTISTSIRELETEFGVQLFLRTGKTIQLTGEGRKLLELADDILRRADDTVQIMTDMAQKRNQIRLGLPPMLGAILLPRIHRQFGAQFPEVRLLITEEGRYRLFEMLDRGELDMVIMSHDPELDADYRFLNITQLEFSYVTGPDNPLADRESVSVSEIGDAPLVLFQSSYQHARRVAELFAQEGLTPNEVYRTSQLSTAFELIRQGSMSGFLYKELRELRPDLRYLSLEPRLDVKIRLYWRRDSFLYSDMEKLIRTLKNMQL